MPFINVKMTPGPTAEQKAELIKRITQLVVDVLGKNPATTHVVIEEVSADNWGIAGETVASRKKRGA
jgi:4-oxalocrotonate tautomerase